KPDVLAARRQGNHCRGDAGCERQSAAGGERATVCPPHFPAPDGSTLGKSRALLAHARHHPVRQAAQIELAPARLDDAAQRLCLRPDQLQAVLAGRTTPHVVLDPGAVVVGQSPIVQRPEERHYLFAALHSPSPVSSSFDGASSPRYSRSLFCIFRRAWKMRLITVPLRMPRTLAI